VLWLTSGARSARGICEHLVDALTECWPQYPATAKPPIVSSDVAGPRYAAAGLTLLSPSRAASSHHLAGARGAVDGDRHRHHVTLQCGTGSMVTNANTHYDPAHSQPPSVLHWCSYRIPAGLHSASVTPTARGPPQGRRAVVVMGAAIARDAL